MANIFKTVKIGSTALRRNTFDLSHEFKFSSQMGRLTPILCREVLPGDTWNNTTESLIRFAPLLAPIMHRVNVYTHFFFVPNRIVWDEWEDFITKGVTGTDTPVLPVYSMPTGQNFLNSSLGDYLGLPTISTQAQRISVLPFRAYQQIYNDYYRDQNLTEPIEFSHASGAVNSADWSLLSQIRYRAWEKDYFTSALPFVQRGNPAEVPVSIDAAEGSITYKSGQQNVFRETNGALANASNIRSTTLGVIQGQIPNGSGSREVNINVDNSSSLSVDLSNSSGQFTINDFRRANALQKWMEISARVGSRYKEQLLGMFGVVSKDSRLQRAEYLGGGLSPVVISEVLQTSQTTSDSPQANMAGHAISAGKTHQFKKFFTEHGYIIGIMSIVPKPNYQDGIPREFLHLDNMDFAFPQFGNLGEQPIYNAEIWATSANPRDTFGYTPRYAEYKFQNSRVSGDFKTTLNFWHLGRIFASQPVLNQQFVQINPSELERIFAVSDEGESDKLWIQVYHKCYVKRPLPKYGTPNLL